MDQDTLATVYQTRPFRVVVSRRVTEEETVSFDCFCDTPDMARTVMAGVLSDLREHRRQYNEQVVLATKAQVDVLDAQLATKAMELNDLNQTLAESKAKVAKFARR
jgi:hypothetical protein